MKNIVSAIFIALLLTACAKNEVLQNNRITGSWYLIETYNDIGDGLESWYPVKPGEGFYMQFKANGETNGNAFPQARTYEVLNENTLMLIFEDGTFIKYHYALRDATLLLSNSGCIEGCGLKFVRMQ